MERLYPAAAQRTRTPPQRDGSGASALAVSFPQRAGSSAAVARNRTEVRSDPEGRSWGLLAFVALRLCWGAALLFAPRLVARAAGLPPRSAPDRAMSRVERALGLRHGVQALAEAALGARALVPGAAVDALHAGSMVLLARLDGARRTAAERDAVVEAAFVALGLTLAGSMRRTGAKASEDPAGPPAIPA